MTRLELIARVVRMANQVRSYTPVQRLVAEGYIWRAANYLYPLTNAENIKKQVRFVEGI